MSTQLEAGPTNQRASDAKRFAAEKHRLEADNVHLTKANEKLVVTSAKRTEMVKRMTIQVSGRAARNATGNFATMPARATPCLGAGLTLAGTAMDLKDACDLLRDLNELNAEFDIEQHELRKVCGFHIPGFN